MNMATRHGTEGVKEEVGGGAATQCHPSFVSGGAVDSKMFGRLLWLIIIIIIIIIIVGTPLHTNNTKCQELNTQGTKLCTAIRGGNKELEEDKEEEEEEKEQEEQEEEEEGARQIGGLAKGNKNIKKKKAHSVASLLTELVE
ncbi:hypothetical protein E2C01_020596 [Portunus trituberculatus]|uniref:Uncharacterized protein n=1 Tax=Portunus trituberculatus TaxID=210409 RepID=A0A5B7E1Y4_PORTR|nr:hypothetical protein [Portunus trituberculatus]